MKTIEQVKNEHLNKTPWQILSNDNPSIFDNIWHDLVKAIGDYKGEWSYSTESQEKASLIIKKVGFEKALDIVGLFRKNEKKWLKRFNY